MENNIWKICKTTRKQQGNEKKTWQHKRSSGGQSVFQLIRLSGWWCRLFSLSPHITIHLSPADSSSPHVTIVFFSSPWWLPSLLMTPIRLRSLQFICLPAWLLALQMFRLCLCSLIAISSFPHPAFWEICFLGVHCEIIERNFQLYVFLQLPG